MASKNWTKGTKRLFLVLSIAAAVMGFLLLAEGRIGVVEGLLNHAIAFLVCVGIPFVVVWFFYFVGRFIIRGYLAEDKKPNQRKDEQA